MADRYMDFDAAVIEEGKPAITFTIGEREYILPADMPAKVILVQMRSLGEDGTLTMGTGVMADWLEALVGDKHLEQMYDDGVTWPQMAKLLSFLMKEYGLGSADDDADEDDEGDDSPNS